MSYTNRLKEGAEDYEVVSIVQLLPHNRILLITRTISDELKSNSIMLQRTNFHNKPEKILTILNLTELCLITRRTTKLAVIESN